MVVTGGFFFLFFRLNVRERKDESLRPRRDWREGGKERHFERRKGEREVRSVPPGLRAAEEGESRAGPSGAPRPWASGPSARGGSLSGSGRAIEVA